jgi:hypothetical protein
VTVKGDALVIKGDASEEDGDREEHYLLRAHSTRLFHCPGKSTPRRLPPNSRTAF